MLPDEHVTVLEADDRRSREGIQCHVGAGRRISLADGMRISAVDQMFVELATQLTLVDLVVVGDYLVRRKLIEVTELVAYCASSSLPGAALARRAASFVRARVDSPMESRLRMLIVLAGLPEPMVNITITDVHGQPVRRYDLSWPEVKAIVEYIGRHHIEREEQWEADLQRREAIDDDEWRLLVVVASGIYKRPAETIQRIWRLLDERRLPALPRRLSDAWRPHFPGQNRT